MAQQQIVPGLQYYPEYLLPETEEMLLREIDDSSISGEWMTALSRRVKHFGYFYDYKATKAAPKVAPPFPPCIKFIADHLVTVGIFKEIPQQCIINEYVRGQGINDHSDNIIFCEPIVTISLNADTIMTFKRGSLHHDQLLQRRSIAIMTGDARWMWTHGISKNVSYNVTDGNGQLTKVTKPANYRRVSVTFRSYQ